MTTNRVAAYIRVSDPKQAERESHQTQIDEMKPVARERGYVDIVWFKEPGISGEEISNRDKFQELLTRSQNGEFKVWFVYRVNRIGRFKNPLDRYLVQQIIVKHRIIIHSLNEGVLNPAENDDDVFKLEDLLSAARKSNIALSEDVRKGQNRVRRAGRYAAGGIPFFVDWNPKTREYELNEGCYETFCEVLRLLQGDLGLHRTVNILNANLQKHPPKKAKKWSTGTISGWFHPRKGFPKNLKAQFYYTGIHYQNIMDRDGNPKPESEWVRVDIGAQIGRQYLFPKEVIDEVMIKMKSRRKRREEGEESLFDPDDFILENLIQCGECGRNLGIHAWREKKTKKVYRYYKCSNRDEGNCSFRFVVADDLDMNVLVRFLENVSDPEKLQKAIIEEELLPKSKRRDVESISRKAVQDREETIGKLERLELLFVDQGSHMRKETYDLKKAELEKTLAEVESTIRKAEHTLSRPDEFMRAAKAASEWFAEKVLIFSDVTPGKKPWGGGEVAEKSLLNIKNLPPEEKRLTFAQLQSMLTRYVGASSKIKVWSAEKFIISGFLPPVTGSDSILTSSNVSRPHWR